MPSNMIYSTFVDDPDMMEIVEMFVDEMPDRIQALRDALAQNEVATLSSLAHQMKGAAGGYGFDSVTDAARVAEEAAKANKSGSELSTPFEALLDLMGRMSSDVPAKAT